MIVLSLKNLPIVNATLDNAKTEIIKMGQRSSSDWSKIILDCWLKVPKILMVLHHLFSMLLKHSTFSIIILSNICRLKFLFVFLV